ncbi:ParD-like family protein [Alteriqipengyuania sp. 357]
MGLVKIDDELHEQVRRASSVMCRSINAQAEFWMKIGRLAEANPSLSFNEIVSQQLALAEEGEGEDGETRAAA